MDISIANLIFLLVGLSAGFVCGYLVDPHRLQEFKEDAHIIKSIARKAKGLQKHTGLGTIHRPTAQQVQERGTVVEATKDAMRETLQNDPYLNENYQN